MFLICQFCLPEPCPCCKLQLYNYAMKIKSSKSTSGVTLIEIIVTILWFSICIVPIIFTYSELVILQTKLFHKYQALSMTQKNIEIITNISQGNWARITSQPVSTPLTLEQDPSTGYWDIKPGVYRESIYESHFIFNLVCRNSDFEIVACDDPSVVAQDPNTIQITSQTQWQIRGNTQKVELTTNLNKII